MTRLTREITGENETILRALAGQQWRAFHVGNRGDPDEDC
jgi:hypothetical protein